MSDPAHEYTDEEIKRVERRLAREYKQAGAEIQQKMEKYLERSAVNNEKKRQQVENGELSEEEYKKWLYGQTMVGQRWKEMRDNLAVDYHNANLRAKGITGQSLPRVYAENFNFGTYMCEKQAKISTAFTLYNERAVRKLATDDPKLLPARKTTKSAENKDISWNKKKITSAMMQGILQGEPIDKVAKRLQAVTDMNEHAAIRNARTMMTSVQNSARLDSFIEMQEKTGVPMSKRWLATLDGRTRHSHRIVDGTTVKLKEPFANGLQFPADPDGAPAEVYNCRCRLVMKINEIDDDLFDMSNRNTDKLKQEYEDWKNAHAKAEKAEAVAKAIADAALKPYHNDKVKGTLKGDYDDFVELMDSNPPTRDMYEKYIDECNEIRRKSGGGCYNSNSDIIEYGIETRYEGLHKLSTFAHECGHMFDKHIGKHPGLTFSEVDMINDRCVFGTGIYKLLHYGPSQSDQFLGALRRDMETLLPKLKDRSLYKELAYGEKHTYNASGGIQDALDGFYSTQKDRILRWGHGDSYYNRQYNRRIKGMNLDKELKSCFIDLGYDASNQSKVKRLSRHYDTASEAWANVASALTCGGEELELMEKYMPETVQAFRQISEIVKE